MVNDAVAATLMHGMIAVISILPPVACPNTELVPLAIIESCFTTAMQSTEWASASEGESPSR
jgi:hypothetical protein